MIEKELTISELKQQQLTVLKEFHRFCYSKGLRYYIVYGTLLGAIRHQGYIPWDDDIDVAMPRADYEVFLAEYNQTPIVSRSKAMDISINEKYYLDFAKVYDTQTVLIEYVNNPISIGAYVDVFPIDTMPDSESEALKTLTELLQLERKLQLHNRTGSRGKGKIIKSLLHDIRRVPLKKTRSEVIKDIITIGERYKNQNFNHVSIAVGGFPLLKDYVPKEWYGDPVLLTFEGENFYAPRNSDALLTQWYGDYMTPPLREHQITHHSFDVFWK